MIAILKLLHVVGWSAWFGLAIAEASAGVQARKATEAGARGALARLWVRVGRIQVMTMIVAVLFGLALFTYELVTYPTGGSGYMKEPAYRFVHIMLATGLLAGVMALLASGARGSALASLEKSDEAGFLGSYKRASMFSGIASLLILATIAVVYLRAV